MATTMDKKYLSLTRLGEYDALIKAKIAADDATTLNSAKSHTNAEITKLTNGTTTVKKATSATSATTATKLGSSTVGGSSQPIYLSSGTATKVTAVGTAYGGTGATSVADARTNLEVYSKTEVDSALAGKASSTHNHDSAYDKKGAADTALASAKAYADSAANTVKNTLLNGAGEAYDTLKELGDLIDEKQDAISALEIVAAGKADKTHSHSAATASANGFMTSAMFAKLEGIATGATKVTVDSSLSTTSANAIQNKVVATAINSATDKITANTGSINGHTTAIANLQASVDEFEEITNEEITALFS